MSLDAEEEEEFISEQVEDLVDVELMSSWGSRFQIKQIEDEPWHAQIWTREEDEEISVCFFPPITSTLISDWEPSPI